MLTSWLVGVLGVAVLGAAWVGVQAAWRRSFPDAFDDPDPLAARRGCHDCGCKEIGPSVCKRRESEEGVR